jgi:phosphoribosylaminoimidazolecarboxamide formyltransferase / IMP cyclohydrolase
MDRAARTKNIISDRTTIGIGAGQMNRVGSVHIAIAQAGDKIQ